ncbi:MAG: T9SS type A sorting domain-containing protein [Flavobacteriia bacterium]|nr:T9SS type A sorting domain-containing protein [Flavobacteriia bacterium]
MTKLILLIVLICGLKTLQAQFLFDYLPEFEVKKGGIELEFPWMGGLNFVQASEIDFEFDGDMDLFLFDRSYNNIRLFENVENNGVRSYQFVYNSARFFPEDLSHRVALLDFNQDGKNDIFTYGLGGVKVYKNIGNVQEGLNWQLHRSLLYSDYGNNISNLFVSSSDIPAYVDIDFDGDIDILTFDLNGEAMEYHKNMGMEWYNTSDSLVYLLKNKCWGQFKEDPISFSILLNNTTFPCGDGNVADPEYPKKKPLIFIEENNKKKDRHTGSTTLAIDIDNSGVYDLLLGDVSSNNISLLINGGAAPNTNSPMTNYEALFPSNSVPISFPIFPSVFYLDLNFDGNKDLFISGNAKNAAKNFNNTLWYKNISNNNSPLFVQQNDNFISSKTIDIGTGSIPILFDQNGDGLKDLLISCLYRYKDDLEKESAVQLYRNTGSVDNPKYQYIDDNYLNLNQLNLGFRIVPTFGDLDNDGDEDMIIGKEDGSLLFWENTSLANQSAQFVGQAESLKDNLQNNIDVGTYSTPQIFDLNKDGLLDLIIGNNEGKILFYKNIGNTNQFLFQLENSLLGNIDLEINTSEYIYPHFFRHLDTTYLILGSINGKLNFYKDVDENLSNNQSFELVSDFFRQINTEAYSSCVVEDLDQDGKLNLIVGGDLGGLFLFEHNPNSSLSEKTNTKNKFSVYPNPFNDKIFIESNQSEYIEIFSPTGTLIYKGQTVNKSIDTKDLSSGFYLLKIRNKCIKMIK